MRSGSDHPDIEELFRYQEGRLMPQERLVVQAHLAVCDECSRDLERITTPGVSPAAAPPVSELLASLAQVQQKLDREGASGEPLKRRVQLELAPYLGEAAAERILLPVTASGENLLSTIEPVLRLFLGKSASTRVVNRIVDRAIVRT